MISGKRRDADDIPDIIAKYHQYQKGKGDYSDKKQKAFVVAKDDIAENKYDLSIIVTRKQFTRRWSMTLRW